MGMVVRTNTMANNAFRQLGMNNSAVSKSLEKLSSGFRINRAGDDAAGLAISERMKAQIKGLDAASSNSQDGISLVQTAEGALNEVHDMLNRMVELATKAANGVYTESQRGNYADEVKQLQDEIDRIADSTNFNSLNLLDGKMGAAGLTAATVTGVDQVSEVTAVITIDLAALTQGISANGTYSLEIGGVTVTGDALTGNTAASDLASAFNGKTIEIDGVTFDIASAGDKITLTAQTAEDFDWTGKTTISVKEQTGGATTDSATVDGVPTNGVTKADEVKASATIDFAGKTAADVLGNTVTVGDKTYQFVTDAADVKDGNVAVVIQESDDATAIVNAFETAANTDAPTGFTVTVDGGTDIKFESTATGAAGVAPEVEFSGAGLTLQVGDTYKDYNMLTIQIGDMHASALGVGKDANGIDITTQIGAGAAIDKINKAIDTVSSTRSNLGAVQNRLEHTINNLDTTSENLSAANSRIRDTDMAKEMMNYTKMNVLVQSAQAMLAQANQQPQSVLQLLQ